jgi:hypothetical protein
MDGRWVSVTVSPIGHSAALPAADVEIDQLMPIVPE